MRTIAALPVLLWLVSVDPIQAQDRAVDPDQLYQASVRDRIEGRNAEAISGLRRVLVLRPQDADARLNLALALIASDRLDEAEAELDAVLAKAPDYADAKVARGRIDRLRTSRRSWRLDVSAARSGLTQGLAPWRETSATLSRRAGQTTVTGAVEYAERFERTDTYVEARLDRALGRSSVFGAVGGTLDADFRPRIALRAGGQTPVGDQGLAATLDAGLARYASGTVTMVQPGLEYASPGGALLLGGRWINVWDEREDYRSGYSLRMVLAIHSSIRLRAGYADAPELSDGTTVDVRSSSLGAEADVTDRLTLRVNGLREERDTYERDEIILGFGVRF